MKKPVYQFQAETAYGLAAIAYSGKNIYSLKLGEDAMGFIKWDLLVKGYDTTLDSDDHGQVLIDELNNYFEGDLQEFSFTPVFLGTDFQKKIYQELMQVGYGEVITYGELAERAGRPKAARAVGTAMANNRIAFVVPCHRVIGTQGGLGGYGYGLDMKEKLLAMEKRISIFQKSQLHFWDYQ